MSTNASVVPFPEKPFREWVVVSRALEESLIEAGHDVETIEHALSIIKPFFMGLWKSENFSVVVKEKDVAEGVRQVDLHIQTIVNSMLLHLTNLAIENYHLKKSAAQ